MMRIGILALIQESNTFLAQPTEFRHFAEELLVTGDEIHQRMGDAHHEIGGMLQGLDEAGAEAVPIFAARALPYGCITGEAINRVLAMMFDALDQAGPLDGILVAPHGATVSEPYPDVDGHWLTEVRRRVGPAVPIIGTLDPHGNLSPQMVAACNALIAYRTNPHLDQRARGIDAARMLVNTINGKWQPTMAAAFPPLAINIEKQCTSEEPCLSLYKLADEMQTDERVLANSIMLGFPYADVAEMGSAVITVTNGNPLLARQLSDTLAGYLWANRHDFVAHLLSVEEAIAQAEQLPGPVCLLDMGDNVGGGSPGDGTVLAHALLQQKVPRSLVVLYDPEMAALATAASVGARVSLTVGGKADALHGPPLVCEATVLGLFDGKFTEPLPRHGGLNRIDQGATAVVVTDTGLTLVLNSRRTPPFSLRQLTSCGINPRDFQILVAKGVNAPLAAYREVCQHYLRVNTLGSTTADLFQLSYHHRRQPMFPWETEMEWDNRGT